MNRITGRRSAFSAPLLFGALLTFLLLAPLPAQSGEEEPQAGISANELVKVFPFNDLGMHCVDKEFSVFSILPPYNVVNAQAVYRNPNGKPILLSDNWIEMHYAPMTDLFGDVNSRSIGKTDFWTYAQQLFGVPLNPGEGLRGLYMPADAPQPGPQPMHYDPIHRWFSAEGIPITPITDKGKENSFPLMRFEATYRPTGSTVARTGTVVPVSSETDCRTCHATGEMAAKNPLITWSTDPDIEKQAKKNVLILHDHQEGTALLSSQPVLCASCHYSAALDLDGIGPSGSQIGKPTMSATMHRYHGELTAGGAPVFPPNGTVEETCYKCHPGNITQCQRGAMKTGGMDCNACHGDMLAVGGKHPLLPGGSYDGTNDGKPRRPWLDLPRCQSCHTGDALDHLGGSQYSVAPDGIRFDRAWVNNDPSASPIVATNKRFAENPGTHYRFSHGHGGLACEACHGSSHAIWPNATLYSNDNVTAWQLQKHIGTVTECSTCHAEGTLPANTTKGPHGMHNTIQSWVDESAHKYAYEANKNACLACHGADKRGTVLSRAAMTRTFVIDDDPPNPKTITIPRGTVIGCNLCHEMPK